MVRALTTGNCHVKVAPLTLRIGLLLAITATARAQTHFPPPTASASNPTSTARALLGKALFWDEHLSSARTVACGTCHRPDHGGCDPRAPSALHPGQDHILGTADDVRGSAGVVAQDAGGRYIGDPVFGVRPQVTPRRALSVVNAAYETTLMWDGRVTNAMHDPRTNANELPDDAALEQQAVHTPIDPSKMGHQGRTWEDIGNDLGPLRPLTLASRPPADLAQFTANTTYAELFERTFGSKGISAARVGMAIAAYERTLVADQSPFDLFLAKKGELDPAESRGHALFVTHCATCHTDLESLDRPASNDFRRTGVRPVTEDPGRFVATQDPVDLGRFKVPSLRNVALRTPYMHNGGLPTLSAVLEFYNRGGDFGPGLDPAVRALRGRLSAAERDDLIAFLHSLTDPRLEQEAAPFDRPQLWSEGQAVPVRLGCPTSGRSSYAPQIIAVSPPYRGNRRFTVAADGAPPGVEHSLVLDFARLPAPGLLLGHPTYLAVSKLRLYGCGKTCAAADGTGFTSLVLDVPPDPLLVGMRVYGQWFFVDPDGVEGMVSSPTFSAVVF